MDDAGWVRPIDRQKNHKCDQMTKHHLRTLTKNEWEQPGKIIIPIRFLHVRL